MAQRTSHPRSGGPEDYPAGADPLTDPEQIARFRAELDRDPMGDLMQLSKALEAVADFISRFVVFQNDAQLVTVALWVAHSHLIKSAYTTPYLVMTSPEKESGKTRVLEVLQTLVANPIMTSNISEAALYRTIEARQPTLLIDEADSIWKRGPNSDQYQGFRQVLNAGHSRNNPIIRLERRGSEWVDVEFDAFCPKALAMIGEPPDTIRSRSVPIRMRRKLRSEPVERFRLKQASADAKPIRDQLEELASVLELSESDPELPDELTDREMDGWEPLLAIADAARSEWPQRARAAAVALSSNTYSVEAGLGVRLLTDLRDTFGADAFLYTDEILERLHRLDESPWGDHSGKPLSAHMLGRMLAPYGIHSQRIRSGKKSKRGYRRADLKDSFDRYVPIPHSESDTSGTTLTQQEFPLDSQSGT